jgi:nucleotide-binding universal stress UspA family protein
MRILFAVDDSQSARTAATALARFAPPDHLRMLHVVDVARYQHPSMPPMIPPDYYVRMQDLLARAGQLLLNEIKATLPFEFIKQIETAVEVGRPADTILEAVAKHHPDLLVLGSRGLDTLQEWFVGGVSYRVVSRAACPVLLVKRPVETFARVLLAYDGSDEADRAADFLDRGMFNEKVEVTIATVWPEQPAAMQAPGSGAEQFMNTVKTAVAELVEKVRSRLPSGRFATVTEVLVGDPSKALVRLADERKMDLIVVGTRGLSGVKRMFLGSVSHAVVHKAPCAVLVVKGGG